MRAEEISRETKFSGHVENCVVCGAAISDVRVKLASSYLKACSSCGTWVYFPRPKAEEQAEIHDTKDYFDHPYFELRRRSGQAHLRRCREILSRMSSELDAGSLQGRSLLDVGCDTGAFLATAAREFGISPIGLDVSSRAVALAAQQGIEVYRATIEAAPEHLCELSAITAIDLIEHVSDPADFLRGIRKRLRPGGVVYLETPNICSAVYRVGRILSVLTGGHPTALYQRLFPVQHIQYFTQASLAALAETCGLELAKMGTRVLPGADIAASAFFRTAMAVMQVFDRLTRERILVWAVLRRPV